MKKFFILFFVIISVVTCKKHKKAAPPSQAAQAKCIDPAKLGLVQASVTTKHLNKAFSGTKVLLATSIDKSVKKATTYSVSVYFKPAPQLKLQQSVWAACHITACDFNKISSDDDYNQQSQQDRQRHCSRIAPGFIDQNSECSADLMFPASFDNKKVVFFVQGESFNSVNRKIVYSRFHCHKDQKGDCSINKVKPQHASDITIIQHHKKHYYQKLMCKKANKLANQFHYVSDKKLSIMQNLSNWPQYYCATAIRKSKEIMAAAQDSSSNKKMGLAAADKSSNFCPADQAAADQAAATQAAADKAAAAAAANQAAADKAAADKTAADKAAADKEAHLITVNDFAAHAAPILIVNVKSEPTVAKGSTLSALVGNGAVYVDDDQTIKYADTNDVSNTIDHIGYNAANPKDPKQQKYIFNKFALKPSNPNLELKDANSFYIMHYPVSTAATKTPVCLTQNDVMQASLKKCAATTTDDAYTSQVFTTVNVTAQDSYKNVYLKNLKGTCLSLGSTPTSTLTFSTCPQGAPNAPKDPNDPNDPKAPKAPSGDQKNSQFSISIVDVQGPKPAASCNKKDQSCYDAYLYNPFKIAAWTGDSHQKAVTAGMVLVFLGAATTFVAWQKKRARASERNRQRRGTVEATQQDGDSDYMYWTSDGAWAKAQWKGGKLVDGKGTAINTTVYKANVAGDAPKGITYDTQGHVLIDSDTGIPEGTEPIVLNHDALPATLTTESRAPENFVGGGGGIEPVEVGSERMLTGGMIAGMGMMAIGAFTVLIGRSHMGVTTQKDRYGKYNSKKASLAAASTRPTVAERLLLRNTASFKIISELVR